MLPFPPLLLPTRDDAALLTLVRQCDSCAA
jgi:hypothetical protein